VWEIRVTTGRDPATGRSVQRSFTHHGNEASAQARQREMVELYGVRAQPSAPPAGPHMRVRELLETFLDSAHRWSATTWRTHTGEARMLCRDRLGRARLNRMTTDTMERAIARWVHAGASAAVVSARFRVLHSAISWGIRTKLITDDPLKDMRSPSRPHPRLHLRPGQVHQLVVAADEAVDKARARLAERPRARQRVLDVFLAEQNALLVRLAADSGARRGELTALQTSDLQGRVLSISRASQDGIIGPVKNHLNGRLTLAASTATYWTHHVQDWTGQSTDDDESSPRWLFRATPECTAPLLPNGLGQRFEKLARAAGHPDATLQRLRHTVGTYLVAHGKILQACARLRHRDVATTLRNYAHALPLDDEDVADFLANLYGLTNAEDRQQLDGG
jgi:integrase